MDLNASGGRRPLRVSVSGVCAFTIAVAVFAVSAAAAAAASAPPPPPAPAAASDTLPVARMTVAEAIPAASRGEIVLVDLRATGQRALGHIAGDIHIPLEQLPARRGELPGDLRWVFYCSCRAEELSLEAARAMIRGGRSNVAALVGGFDAWKAAGGPVRVDAPWEVVFRVDDPPAGWGRIPVDSTRCRYARDDSVAHGGKASARIACTPDPGARGFAGFMQRIAVGDLRGRRLTLSAMARSEGIDRIAFLYIAAEDSLGRMLPVTRPDSDPITGTTDWRPVQVGGVVPPVAVRLVVGLSLATSGRVWLDDVRLVAGEEPGRPAAGVAIRNHGFEE